VNISNNSSVLILFSAKFFGESFGDFPVTCSIEVAAKLYSPTERKSAGE
jgi:hypothetical protein